MSKTGRNDLCHCGSGQKFKKCHGVKATAAASGNVMLVLVGAAILAAIVVGIASFSGDGASGTTRVWSAEHGHYHDASGTAVP
jgi:hypothetical protein